MKTYEQIQDVKDRLEKELRLQVINGASYKDRVYFFKKRHLVLEDLLEKLNRIIFFPNQRQQKDWLELRTRVKRIHNKSKIKIEKMEKNKNVDTIINIAYIIWGIAYIPYWGYKMIKEKLSKKESEQR